MRIAVAVYAYHGRLDFGITGDYDSTADLDVFRAGIADGFRQLLDATGTTPAPPAAVSGPRAG
jgi:hypothetical protein